MSFSTADLSEVPKRAEQVKTENVEECARVRDPACAQLNPTPVKSAILLTNNVHVAKYRINQSPALPEGVEIDGLASIHAFPATWVHFRRTSPSLKLEQLNDHSDAKTHQSQLLGLKSNGRCPACHGLEGMSCLSCRY